MAKSQKNKSKKTSKKSTEEVVEKVEAAVEETVEEVAEPVEEPTVDPKKAQADALALHEMKRKRALEARQIVGKPNKWRSR